MLPVVEAALRQIMFTAIRCVALAGVFPGFYVKLPVGSKCIGRSSSSCVETIVFTILAGLKVRGYIGAYDFGAPQIVQM